LAQTYKFAVVPKAMNNPFFDVARDGCLQARQGSSATSNASTRGPIEHEPATQAQIIQDFVTQKVDGLAISVADVAAMTKSIEAATAAGIPVITFDADAPGSKRIAYIGTNNKDFRPRLGKQLLQLKARRAAKYAIGLRAARRQEPCRARRWRREALKGSEMGRGRGLADLLQ
jgi:ribose transport system substrate-binding protein